MWRKGTFECHLQKIVCILSPSSLLLLWLLHFYLVKAVQDQLLYLAVRLFCCFLEEDCLIRNGCWGYCVRCVGHTSLQTMKLQDAVLTWRKHAWMTAVHYGIADCGAVYKEYHCMCPMLVFVARVRRQCHVAFHVSCASLLTSIATCFLGELVWPFPFCALE